MFVERFDSIKIMKLLKCSAQNFASYANLELDFTSPSLTLIHGPTGSGKSTILDMVSWALYGLTAKNGSVDEVRSWNTPDEPTKAILSVLVGSQELVITRVRAATASHNDLYWQVMPGHKEHRGKNLSETQDLLEKALGCTSEQFLTGAYFHEFSKTSTFFLSKAKDRRVVFENIADLSFPANLAERSSEKKKKIKKSIASLQDRLNRLGAKTEQLEASYKATTVSLACWAKKNKQQIQELEDKAKSFYTDKAAKLALIEEALLSFEASRITQIIELEDFIRSLADSTSNNVSLESCSECGSIKNRIERTTHETSLRELENSKRDHKYLLNLVNPHISDKIANDATTNEYASLILEKKTEVNPFLSQKDAIFCDKVNTRKECDKLSVELSSLERESTALDSIYELSFKLRGELLRQAVRQVEDSTNRNLETYFDSELRVVFALDEDELKTEIYKNGNSCVYSQLSKGQRGLLKLTFAVAIMLAASNSAGVNFNTLFFDEALDGYDADLKVKAFRLFEDLATKHDNVYVIDHSEELKAMFRSEIRVIIENDISQIIQ